MSRKEADLRSFALVLVLALVVDVAAALFFFAVGYTVGATPPKSGPTQVSCQTPEGGPR